MYPLGLIKPPLPIPLIVVVHPIRKEPVGHKQS